MNATKTKYTGFQALDKTYSRIERAIANRWLAIYEVRELGITSGEVVQAYFKFAKANNRLNMRYREDGTPEYTVAK